MSSATEEVLLHMLQAAQATVIVLLQAAGGEATITLDAIKAADPSRLDIEGPDEDGTSIFRYRESEVAS